MIETKTDGMLIKVQMVETIRDEIKLELTLNNFQILLTKRQVESILLLMDTETP